MPSLNSTAETEKASSLQQGFGNSLAHTSKKVRDTALRGLAQWLADRAANLSELDLMKLWKGLFYCECCLNRVYLCSYLYL
jgi:hypothetical protein